MGDTQWGEKPVDYRGECNTLSNGRQSDNNKTKSATASPEARLCMTGHRIDGFVAALERFVATGCGLSHGT